MSEHTRTCRACGERFTERAGRPGAPRRYCDRHAPASRRVADAAPSLTRERYVVLVQRVLELHRRLDDVDALEGLADIADHVGTLIDVRARGA